MQTTRGPISHRCCKCMSFYQPTLFKTHFVPSLSDVSSGQSARSTVWRVVRWAEIIRISTCEKNGRRHKARVERNNINCARFFSEWQLLCLCTFCVQEKRRCSFGVDQMGSDDSDDDKAAPLPRRGRRQAIFDSKVVRVRLCSLFDACMSLHLVYTFIIIPGHRMNVHCAASTMFH